MNTVVVVLSILAIILIYVLYLYFKKSALTSGVLNLNTFQSLDNNKLDRPFATDYYYEGWVFVQTPSAIPKNLFGRDVYFSLDNNNLAVYKKASPATPSVPDSKLFDITSKFPIQKWVHLAMNVYSHSTNSTTIECYINGKLVTTKPNQSLNDFDASNPPQFTMGANAGHTGYLTKVNRVPNTVNAEQVWARYLEGNGVSGYVAFLSNYNVNLNILKDNTLERRINLI